MTQYHYQASDSNENLQRRLPKGEQSAIIYNLGIAGPLYGRFQRIPELFDKFCKKIIQSRLLMVEGKLQVEGEVIHVVAIRCFNLNKLLRGLTVANEGSPPQLTLARADETTAPGPDSRETFHKGRNFR